MYTVLLLSTLSLSIERDNLTSGWLLSEVIRYAERKEGESRCKSERKIVALKHSSKLEGVDFLLSQYERNLTFLEQGDVLLAVYSSCKELS